MSDFPRMRRHLRVILALTLASRGALGEPTRPPAPESTPAEPLPPTPAPTTSALPTAAPETAAPSSVAPATVAPSSVAPATVTPATVAVSPVAPSPVALSGSARIRIASDHADAWLETRPFGGDAAWQRGCPAPCGRALTVDGVELRVTAPDMTPSKPFRVEAGSGSALLSVSGGSATARTWGRASFAIGVPVALLGMTGFALGSFDDRAGLKGAGAVSLGVGAALVLVALPLLVHGATTVKNDKGDAIAAARASESF